MQPLVVIPAIHVHDGHAVRLDRGAVGSERSLGDAVEWARRFSDDGAGWLQLVDLDAARDTGDNHELSLAVVEAVRGRTQVLFGGGMTQLDELAALFDAGVARALIGTSSHDTPQWCRGAVAEFGDRVVIGLDVDPEGRPTHGWASGTGSVPHAVELLNEMGCSRVVVRCLASDGHLTGPNYELLGALCARTEAAVIASGGIAEIEDLRRLRGLVPIGVEGAVVGTAFAQGTFDLADALRVATGERPVAPALDGDDE